jgi:hypothetical protein
MKNLQEFLKTIFSTELEKTVADDKKVGLPIFDQVAESPTQKQSLNVADSTIVTNELFHFNKLSTQSQFLLNDNAPIESNSKASSELSQHIKNDPEVSLENIQQYDVTENFAEDFGKKFITKNIKDLEDMVRRADNAKNILDGKVKFSGSSLKDFKINYDEEDNNFSLEERRLLKNAETRPNLKTHLGEQVNKIAEEQSNNLRDRANVLSANKVAINAVSQNLESKENKSLPTSIDDVFKA